MSQENNQPTIENKLDSLSKIETIKNLIFGDQIAQYDTEIEVLKRDILAKREEIKSLVEETSLELNTLIDNLSTDLNIRITELENNFTDSIDGLKEQTVNKKLLGNLLIKLGNQISE